MYGIAGKTISLPVSIDKRYTFIFNGKIYNDIDVLDSYIKQGPRCLDKLNGKFAFAIWDKEKKELFCARDRLGIKPFYYTIQDKNFHFASEIKNLDVKKEANESIIYDYLRYSVYGHSEETFFKGIKKLNAGHYLIWKNNKVKITKYWDLANKRQDIPEKQVKESFEELLTDSIKLRLDSNMGLNLSSGLDSNVLLHYTYKVAGTKLPLFSMCMDSKKYDECRLIKVNDEKYWHKSCLKPDELFPLAKKVNEIQDQPFGGVPTLAYAKLNEKAKEKGIDVLFEGQGGDELLGGYQYYRINDSLKFRCQDMTKFIGEEIMDKDFLNSKKSELSFEKPFKSYLLNAQYRDIAHTTIPKVLRFNGAVNTAYERDVRSPYLDHRIVEFCFRLPKKYKINSRTQKILLRELMGNYKPKKTFSAVQVELFKNHHKDKILEILNSRSFRNRRYWDHNKLMEKVKDFFEGKVDNSFFIWQCINLEMWFREYIDSI